VLQELLDETMTSLHAAVDAAAPRIQLHETGTVLHVGGGIARLKGLPGITADELVQFPDRVLGIAINLEPNEIGVMLLGDSNKLSAGIEVSATGREADTPVGEGLLGRVLDATGRALDHVNA